MACSWRAANDDHDRFRRNRQARSANRDIVSVSEPEQAELIHGEGRTIITYLYGASYDIHFGR